MKHDPFFNPMQSACQGKHAFASWGEAQKSVARKKRCAKARGNVIPQIEPYRCGFCGSYHVGGRSK